MILPKSCVVFVVGAALLACTGGTGSLVDDTGAWDPPPSSRDTAPASQEASNNREAPPASLDGVTASGDNVSSQGGTSSSFSCSGTFSCTVSGETVTTSVSQSGESCVFSDFTLEPGGQVKRKGSVVASWSATANGFTIVASGQSITCTRTSSAGTGSSSTGSSSTGSTSTGSASSGSSGSSGTSGSSGSTTSTSSSG